MKVRNHKTFLYFGSCNEVMYDDNIFLDYTGKALESSHHNHCLTAHIQESQALVRTRFLFDVNIYLLAKKFNHKILVNTAKRILKFLKVYRCLCQAKCLKLPDHFIHTVSTITKLLNLHYLFFHYSIIILKKVVDQQK